MVAALPPAFLAVLVVLSVVFNAALLWPELLTGAPTRSDSAFHLLMINGASDALSRGQSPLDFWIPQLELGFPQFLYYQNLPHLIVVGVHRLLFGAIALESVYNISRFVLLIVFPITVYWSMRRMGFAQAAAAFAAAASSLISADARYGFEYNSYIWRGFGLYSQLWGMHLTFIAIACLHYALRQGRGYAAAVASLAALALSHMLLAYMMSLTGVMLLVALSDRQTIRTHLTRFVAIGVSAIVVASYMIILFALSSGTYMSRRPDVGGPGSKSSADFFNALVSGDLFDYGRLPVLTALVALGVVVAVVRYKQVSNREHRFAVAGLLAWLVLLLWRPTVGPLAELFPVHGGYVTSRFISAVDVFAILTIGVSGQWLWEMFGRFRSRTTTPNTPGFSNVARPFFAVLVLLTLLMPAFAERRRYYAGSRDLMTQTRDALAANPDISTVLNTVRQQPGGHLYAGMRNNWGAQMRISSSLSVGDYVRFLGIPQMGMPYQSLSLSASILGEFREGDEAMFDILDVRWAVTPAAANVPNFYLPYFRTSNFALYRVRTSGIADYVAIHERRTASTEDELYKGNRDWFMNDAMNKREFIRWDYRTAPGPFTRSERCADGGKLGAERVSAGQVHLEAECATASTLLLKMTYHPNWQVAVDGNRVETFMVSPSFLGIDLPPGRHVVDATYVPTPLKLPLALLGLAVLLCWVVFGKKLARHLEFPRAQPA